MECKIKRYTGELGTTTEGDRGATLTVEFPLVVQGHNTGTIEQNIVFPLEHLKVFQDCADPGNNQKAIAQAIGALEQE